jgi:hypothetical protein
MRVNIDGEFDPRDRAPAPCPGLENKRLVVFNDEVDFLNTLKVFFNPLVQFRHLLEACGNLCL